MEDEQAEDDDDDNGCLDFSFFLPPKSNSVSNPPRPNDASALPEKEFTLSSRGSQSLIFEEADFLEDLESPKSP